jgi:hypothetical protein
MMTEPNFQLIIVKNNYPKPKVALTTINRHTMYEQR